ncbi:ISAs1 family transposase (plasmid) [Photobacterium sp. GJ3]|uniref:ISAs1 family transposase n=1 Tax=Photobacterium sp. GJ3 TaxID=2829502 RepID=UPI001B8D48BE|nr:ISAs1 family transposase [Photobacterium sp. GJ3]QUJ69245.1 ISAs1 family transposase [Photobacterium sp. GJ3]
MSLFDHLSIIEDTRSRINRQHDLVDIMFLVMAAVASGCEGWLEIEAFGHDHINWLRKYRRFENGIPTRHSIARIIKAVHVESLVLALFSWVNALREQTGRPVIAIDGKTLRGAVNQNGREKALHMVTAFDTEQGVVLYQQPTSTKGSEVATVRDMLTMLDVKDSILTFDALHCNQETLRQIQQRKGDYVVQVKGNQPKLKEAIEAAFMPHWDEAENLPQQEERTKGHGRSEHRTLFQLPAQLSKELTKKWPSAKSFIAIERERRNKGKTTIDTHFYISSLDVDPKLAFRSVRQHWYTENQQHWVLDVVFREDLNQIGDREAAERMALFRRIILNLAQQHPAKSSKKLKIKRAGWSDDFRSELFFG